jgi:signal transduction histidine kinase
LVGFTDLTEMKKYEQSLKEKNLELLAEHDTVESSKRYIKTQENFIDTLCHELRNPLNGIVHGIEMLQDAVQLLQQKDFTTAEQDKIFEDISNREAGTVKNNKQSSFK